MLANSKEGRWCKGTSQLHCVMCCPAPPPLHRLERPESHEPTSLPNVHNCPASRLQPMWAQGGPQAGGQQRVGQPNPCSCLKGAGRRTRSCRPCTLGHPVACGCTSSLGGFQATNTPMLPAAKGRWRHPWWGLAHKSSQHAPLLRMAIPSKRGQLSPAATQPSAGGSQRRVLAPSPSTRPQKKPQQWLNQHPTTSCQQRHASAAAVFLAHMPAAQRL